MRRTVLALFLLTMGAGTGVWANAQARPMGADVIVPRVDIGVGYNYIRANAPPGGCQCFNLNGGFASAGFHFNSWLGAAGEMSGSTAKSISGLGQNLTLITFMGGPRVSHQWGRLAPFGQALFGGAHAGNSYFPSQNGTQTSANKFAFSAGGGVDLALTRHIGVRVVNVQYLRTTFPNGGTDEQNHVSIQSGIVFRFGWAEGGRERRESVAPPPPPPAPKIIMACSAGDATAMEGESVKVNGSGTGGSGGTMTYTWTTTGGAVQGSGATVMINTKGLTPGDYQALGRVTNGTEMADCMTTFHVQAKPEQPVVQTVPPPPPPPSEAAFHEHVPDVFFDYDKAVIRPDGEEAINKGIEYMKANPNVRIQIGGFSDERGTQQYNLILGIKRATAVHDRYVAAGISEDRLRIVSYGKMVQVCTTNKESCYQQNRRAAITPLP